MHLLLKDILMYVVPSVHLCFLCVICTATGSTDVLSTNLYLLYLEFMHISQMCAPEEKCQPRLCMLKYVRMMLFHFVCPSVCVCVLQASKGF